MFIHRERDILCMCVRLTCTRSDRNQWRILLNVINFWILILFFPLLCFALPKSFFFFRCSCGLCPYSCFVRAIAAETLACVRVSCVFQFQPHWFIFALCVHFINIIRAVGAQCVCLQRELIFCCCLFCAGSFKYIFHAFALLSWFATVIHSSSERFAYFAY